MGAIVGTKLGNEEGVTVGLDDDKGVGLAEGSTDGGILELREGIPVGTFVGIKLGNEEGAIVGVDEGKRVGLAEGPADGDMLKF